MKRVLLIIFIISTCYSISKGQDSDKFPNNSAIQAIKTPTKSGISYEALSQFFQSSITTGNSGGFSIKTTAFGIKKLFDTKDSVNYSDYVIANTFNRNFEISLGINKDSTFKITTINAGFKYALLNKRSKSDVNFSNRPELKFILDAINIAVGNALKIYSLDLVNKRKDSAEYKSKIQTFKTAVNVFNSDSTRNFRRDLPADLVKIIDSLSKENIDSLVKGAQKAYNQASKEIDMGSLLTISFNPGYDFHNSRFDTSGFAMQYLRGFGKANKPWNINAQARYVFRHDTLGNKRNLSRQIGMASFGINKTLLMSDKQNPSLELELAFEDDYIMNGAYLKEDRNKIAFNTKFTIHLTSQITLPILIKYDIRHPNLLSLFSLTWNLENGKGASD